MLYSEMNEKQKKAFKNIAYAAQDLIGGLENTLLDYAEDTAEYKSAKNLLNSHETLVKELYRMATSARYEEGCCSFSNSDMMFIRDINFCGKEWLMERCDKRITKMGY